MIAANEYEIAQGYDLADYFLMRNSEVIDTPLCFNKGYLFDGTRLIFLFLINIKMSVRITITIGITKLNEK